MPTISALLNGPSCDQDVHDLSPTCDTCAPVLINGWPAHLLLPVEVVPASDGRLPQLTGASRPAWLG